MNLLPDDQLDQLLNQVVAQERNAKPPVSVAHGAVARLRRRRRQRMGAVSGLAAVALLAVGWWGTTSAPPATSSEAIAIETTPPTPEPVVQSPPQVTVFTPPLPPARVEVAGYIAEPVPTRRPGITLMILHKTASPPTASTAPERMNHKPLPPENRHDSQTS